MTRPLTAFVAIIAMAQASAPASANNLRDAAYMSGADRVEAKPFLFAGPTLRLSLDKRNAKPVAGLRFAGATAAPGLAPTISDGLMLTKGSRGKPALSIAGQDPKILGDRLGMSKGTQTALIVGGVALIGAVVLVASAGVGDAAAAIWDEE